MLFYGKIIIMNLLSKKQMRLIENSKGFSLAELVATLPLGILIVAALTVGIIKFSMAYTEITFYSQLQKEVIDTIESIKYGYPKDPYTTNKSLIGLSTAAKVIIPGSQISAPEITIRPPNLTSSSGDSPNYSRFYLNREGYLMVTSFYGSSTFTEQVFPRGSKKFGKKRKFKILNSDIFTNSTPYNGGAIQTESNPKLVTIHIVARVRFREKKKDQNTQVDLKKNTKTVDFKATIYAANT